MKGKTVKEIDFNQEIRFGMRFTEFLIPVILLASIVLICNRMLNMLTPEDMEVIKGFVASGRPFEFMSAFFLLATLIMVFGYMLVYPLVKWIISKMTGGSAGERSSCETAAG